jgi:hypothetical protein
MMTDYIPAGGPLDTVDVDNTSTAAAMHPIAIDQASAWLTMNRRPQQPVSFQHFRTGGTENERYQTVMVPPGATHVKVSCLYTGGSTVGPTFDIALPYSAGFVGVDSQLPANPEDGNESIHKSTWQETAWPDVVDSPVANSFAHINVKDIAGRNADEWQRATVRMTFTPSGTSYAVHAWTTWPVFIDPTPTP